MNKINYELRKENVATDEILDMVFKDSTVKHGLREFSKGTLKRINVFGKEGLEEIFRRIYLLNYGSLVTLTGNPMKDKVMGPVNYNNLIDRIANILVEARTKVVRQINKAQVLAYCEKGREVIEFEQKGRVRAEYGEKILERLSVDLTDRFRKGFSAENLRLMRKFYLTFRKSKTLSWKFEEDKKQKSQTLSAKYG